MIEYELKFQLFVMIVNSINASKKNH